MRHAALTWLTLASMGLSMPAHASMFDSFGLGTRGSSLGNAMVTLSKSYDGVYYNPANLLAQPLNHIGLGLNLIAPDLGFRSEQQGQELEALLPDINMALHLGLSASLGGVFDHKVALGAVLFHPLLSSTRIASYDPGLPHYYRYQDLPDKLILALAAAFKPIDWARFGLGAQILADLGGTTQAALSLAEKRFTKENFDLELTGSAGLVAGITLGPAWGLQLGITWRSELALSYHVPITVLIEEIGNLEVLLDGVSLYTPDQIAVGLSWESTENASTGISVEAGFTWERWSMAPPAGATFRVSVDDAILRASENAAGRPEQQLIEVSADAIPLEAEDTITPRVGVEWRPVAHWAVRGGWFFRPTPLPKPTGEANTLDTSAHVISLGGGVTFEDPTGVHRKPLTLDLALQVTVLNSRQADKRIEGNTVDTLHFGGLIWHLLADVRHHF